MLKTSIEKLVRREHLDRLSCEIALEEMLSPDANPIQTAVFLALLRSKSETADELTGMLSVLKQKMVALQIPHKVLDIVGTGGDGAHTLNISTGSAILAASCGIKIAKHGNRAVSSLAGSADVLEALGVNIDLTPEKIVASIDKIGIGFCFSPHFHPAMRTLRDLRKQLNIPTTFNLLGPLLNPAHPAHFLLGVFDASLLPLMAETLKTTGTERSFVVHSEGLDEISCIGPAHIFEITPTDVKEFTIDPKKLGFSECRLSDLQGGNAKDNAQRLLEVFSGKNMKKNQAIADTLILNAAVALYLYGLHPSITSAIPHAQENLHHGAALTLLKNWIDYSHD
jgi:anthranilate phosphoribosyltransferase